MDSGSERIGNRLAMNANSERNEGRVVRSLLMPHTLEFVIIRKECPSGKWALRWERRETWTLSRKKGGRMYMGFIMKLNQEKTRSHSLSFSLLPTLCSASQKLRWSLYVWFLQLKYIARWNNLCVADGFLFVKRRNHMDHMHQWKFSKFFDNTSFLISL